MGIDSEEGSPMITPLEAVLFGVLALMVLAWFAGVAKLSRRLRERHPAKYEQMGLEFMWPQNLGQWLSGYNNSGPVFALLRFLWRREDAELGDLEISSQTTFLRWHFALYLILFTALVTSILRGAWVMEVRQKQAAIEVANRPEYRRERVFGPAREKGGPTRSPPTMRCSPNPGRTPSSLTGAAWPIGASAAATKHCRISAAQSSWTPPISTRFATPTAC